MFVDGVPIFMHAKLFAAQGLVGSKMHELHFLSVVVLLQKEHSDHECACLDLHLQPARACHISKMLMFDLNLVDPASSHMLVSKIKPCMSQYEFAQGETANGSLNQL